MDLSFWLALILGGAVGFFASVLANFASPGFGNYFTRSKQGLIERNKKRAVAQYYFIKKFRDGTEDKYMYFVAQWGYIITYLIFCVGFGIVHALVTEKDKFETLFGVTGTIVAGALSAWKIYRLTIWYWRINNFATYKSDLEKRWGSLDQLRS